MNPSTNHLEGTSLSTVASGGFAQSGGFEDDSTDIGSMTTAFGSSGIALGSALARQDAQEKGGGEGETAKEHVVGIVGKAERPRGGGIEREDSREARDYRRFSVTTPPEHQPAYQPKHMADLPTHEHPSGSPVGVGSLPGSNNEFGVARLPDERGQNNPYVFTSSSIAKTTFSPVKNPFKSSLKASKGLARTGSGGAGGRHADMPSTEVSSGSRLGVGSLPGSKKEPGVATLPEERAHGRPYGSLRTGFEDHSPEEGAIRFEKANHHEQGYCGHGHTQQGQDHGHKHKVPGAAASHRGARKSSDASHGHEGRRMSTGTMGSGSEVHEKIHHFFEAGDRHTMEKVDLPSKEELSGSYCGVGSLPGPRKEGAVALTPYERRRHLDNEVDVAQLLPSSETPSISYGGVGSLPGRRDEPGVAVLPHERIHPDEHIVFEQPDRTSRVGGSRHLPGRQHSTAGHGLGVKGTHPQHQQSAVLPTNERLSGSRVGVGSLPGARYEEGVAIFPYERLRHMTNEVAHEELMPTTDTFTPFVYGGVGNMPGRRDESGVALTPEEHQHPESEILKGHPERGHRQAKTGAKSKKSSVGVWKQGTQHVDLPSTEHISGSRIGVGSLPGGHNEEGVAIFPYERYRHMDNETAVEELLPTTDTFTPYVYGGVGNLPGRREETGGAMTPEERIHPESQILGEHHHPPRHHKHHHHKKGEQQPKHWEGMGKDPHGLMKERYSGIRTKLTPQEMYRAHFAEGVHTQSMPKVEMPSSEVTSGSRCGVGSLPGGHDEEGITIFPYERLRHMTNAVAHEELMPTTDTYTPLVCGGVGNLPGRRRERGVAMTPGERMHPEDQIMSGKHKHRKQDQKSYEHEHHFWEGMGNEPHGLTQMRYEGIRTKVTEEEMYRAHFQSGLDNHVIPKVDMPTTEEISGSRCGVGSLPGKHGEEGVALLPYERYRHMDNEIATEELMPSTEVQTPFFYGGVGNLPGKHSEQRVALTPEERLFPADEILMSHLPPRMDEMPSMEHPSGSIVGVGSLPGPRNEKGVALTREERQHPPDQILMAHQKKKTAPKGRGRKSCEGRSSDRPRSNSAKRRSSQGMSRSRSGQHQPRYQHMSAEDTEREALRQIEERTEMMRHTMQRVGGNVRGAVEGATRGLEDMGHRMRQRFGWEHSGGSPVPATSSMSPSASAYSSASVMGVGAGVGVGQSPGGGLRSVSSGGGGPSGYGQRPEGMQRVQSNLSPTAPEFVPHWSMPDVGGMVRGVVGGVRDGIEKVVHDVEGGVEGYLHPRQQGHPTPSDEHVDQEIMSDDDEATLQKVYEAKRLLEKAREDEERAGIRFSSGGSSENKTSVPENLHEEYVKTPTGSRETSGADHSMQQGEHKRSGVTRGVGGVEFDMSVREGMLPGYPTQAGMSALMKERMMDDMSRESQATGGQHPLSDSLKQEDAHLGFPGATRETGIGMGLHREASDVSTSAVRGSTSDLGEQPDEDKFTGNKTPVARGGSAKAGLSLEDLGAPILEGGGRLHESKKGHRDEHAHLHPRRVIN